MFPELTYPTSQLRNDATPELTPRPQRRDTFNEDVRVDIVPISDDMPEIENEEKSEVLSNGDIKSQATHVTETTAQEVDTVHSPLSTPTLPVRLREFKVNQCKLFARICFVTDTNI